jgi:hypothetical protein
MYRRVMLTTLLACTALQVFAQPSPAISFRIVETDPSSRMTLGARQPFYLRIAYKSAVPVRFRAQGYSQGALTERGASYNPAPVYPAGDGEAVAWLAFGGEVRIDEIRVTAHDERWREVASEAFPTDVSWNAAAPRPSRLPAPWARELSDAQQVMTSTALPAPGDGGALGGLLISLMMGSIPAYLVVQAFMLLRYRGGWRKAAMVPLVGMVPLGLYTLVALLAGANLWPLMAIFLTPIALAYLVALWIVKLVAGRLSGPAAPSLNQPSS